MSRFLLSAVGTLALFAGALAANQRLLGTSPIVWIDTVNDEGEVRRCVVEDSCTRTGMSTAIAGQAAAVAWLDFRSALSWLGIGLDGAHRVIQLLNALAVLLVFHLASRLANPWAGAAAVLLFLDGAGALVRVTALHNSSLLLFLGAVLVLACSAVVERPGFVSVGLAALVAAIMANVHLACLLAGPSVVWAALGAPRRRFVLAAFGAGLFALATFALAPPSWFGNLMNLLGPGVPRVDRMAAMSAPVRTMLGWSVFAILAWTVSLFGRGAAWIRYRRRSQGAFAVLVPLLLIFLAAPSLGLSPESKYLFHAKAACAVAAALPLGLLAGALLRALLPPRVAGAVEACVPLALALAIALPAGSGAENERTPTVADLAAIGRIVREERGWDVTRELARLRSPYGARLLVGLRQMNASGAAAAADGDGSALLLVLEEEDLPHPLPSGWKVVSRRSHAVTVLIFTRSRIDWSRFVVCANPSDGGAERCEESGWRPDEAASTFVPHMPPTGWRGRLTVRLALRPDAPEFEDRIFMPRMNLICGGRLSSTAGDGLSVGDDRRRATIPGTVRASGLSLEWDIGSAECDPLAYDGLVPFFVEGDDATVRLLEGILARREG